MNLQNKLIEEFGDDAKTVQFSRRPVKLAVADLCIILQSLPDEIAEKIATVVITRLKREIDPVQE